MLHFSASLKILPVIFSTVTPSLTWTDFSCKKLSLMYQAFDLSSVYWDFIFEVALDVNFLFNFWWVSLFSNYFPWYIFYSIFGGLFIAFSTFTCLQSISFLFTTSRDIKNFWSRKKRTTSIKFKQQFQKMALVCLVNVGALL